ncbi:MAG: membrane dipeptidase [Parachlamydia sp.]|nr:membrane dipeptidase [Parachlamydia sp.]
MSMQIADLHCDLLCYLQGDARRSPFDAAVRCSIPQMQQGGVRLQVLPVFTLTQPGSTQKGWGQVEAFGRLLKGCPIDLFLSIENASGFFEEQEALDIGFKRLDILMERFGRVIYLSPTWNDENRFGGGAHTDIGLKEDGKALLHFLDGSGISYDCSHNSDRLMREALAYIDAHKLDIRIIASHSNMRSVNNVPRNLPDDLAREIFQRGGIIGLNFYKPFVGPKSVTFLARQLEHAFQLGGEKQLCFGADFFDLMDLPPNQRKSPAEAFFPEVSDSSAYPFVLNLLEQQLHISKAALENIAHHNLMRFLKK